MNEVCSSAAHEVTKRSRAAWDALPRVGEMDDGDGGKLELRNCHCGSTIARLIGAPLTWQSGPVRVDAQMEAR